MIGLVAFRRVASVILAFAGTPAASAQSQSPPARGEPCELHIIPSGMFGAINNTASPFSDGLVGGAVAGALAMKRPEDVKAFIEATLSEAEQVRLLESKELPTLLKLPGYRIVPQAASPARFKTFEEPKTLPRLVEGSGSCHAELHVYSLYVLKNPLSRKFYSIFYFREFDQAATPTTFRWGATNTGVTRLPPARAEELDAARSELRNAFIANFESFVAKKVRREKTR